MKMLYYFLLAITLLSCSANTPKTLKIWAIGDGIRVDPVSGKIIENEQDYFGEVVSRNHKQKFHNYIKSSQQRSGIMPANY